MPEFRGIKQPGVDKVQGKRISKVKNTQMGKGGSKKKRTR